MKPPFQSQLARTGAVSPPVRLAGVKASWIWNVPSTRSTGPAPPASLPASKAASAIDRQEGWGGCALLRSPSIYLRVRLGPAFVGTAPAPIVIDFLGRREWQRARPRHPALGCRGLSSVQTSRSRCEYPPDRCPPCRFQRRRRRRRHSWRHGCTMCRSPTRRTPGRRPTLRTPGRCRRRRRRSRLRRRPFSTSALR